MVKKEAETKEKAEVVPKDPDALPTKVTCTATGTVCGVRKEVYAKRVLKVAGEMGILNKIVDKQGNVLNYEDNADDLIHHPDFKKARVELDKTYICREERARRRKKEAAEKKAKIEVVGEAPEGEED